MEVLLYEEVFLKAMEIKRAKNLGDLTSFLVQAINDNSDKKHDLISSRTIKRGFKEFLSPELLESFTWNRESDKSDKEKKYVPSLNTLNLLAVYLDYKSFADFSAQNLSKNQKGEKGKKQAKKPRVTVNQYGKEAVNLEQVTVNGKLIFK